MAVLIRIVNAFYAALFLIGVLGSLGLLAAARDGLGREPEAVWLSAGWALLSMLLAILCLANMRSARSGFGQARAAANAAALLLAGAGLLAGNAAVQWIAGVSIVPFAITLAALIAARRRSGVRLNRS